MVCVLTNGRDTSNEATNKLQGGPGELEDIGASEGRETRGIDNTIAKVRD